MVNKVQGEEGKKEKKRRQADIGLDVPGKPRPVVSSGLFFTLLMIFHRHWFGKFLLPA
jgi:hypothetical protein